MKNYFYKLFFTTVCICSFLFSCTNNVDLSNISTDVQWDGAIAIPIGEANLNIENLLDKIDKNNVLTTEGEEIIYQNEDSTAFRFRDIDLAKNAQSLSTSFPLPPSQTIPANQSANFENNLGIDLGLNAHFKEERIDSAKIQSAILSIKISPENLAISPNNIELTIEFATSHMQTFNGEPVTVSYNPSFFNQVEEKTIRNFVLNTSQNSIIPLILKLKITAGDSPINISPSSKITIEVKFTHFDFEVAYGFFAPSVDAMVIEQQHLNLPSFTNDGDFQFANPQFFFNVKSNIGTYLYFKVDYIKAFKQENPSQEVYARFSNDQDSLSTKEALGNKPSNPGEYIAKQLRVLDKDYGATDRLFSINPQPDVLEYKFSTILDQKKINQDHSANFITPDAQIKVKYKIKIPFNLKSQSYYTSQDTVKDVDIDSTLKDVKVDSAQIVLKVENGLPVKVTLNMVLLDGNNKPINTTFKTSYQIDAPQIVDGYVVPDGIAMQKIIITLNNNQFNDFKQTKNIVFLITINSKDINSNIHFQKSNSFHAKMSLFVKGSYTYTSDNSK